MDDFRDSARLARASVAANIHDEARPITLQTVADKGPDRRPLRVSARLPREFFIRLQSLYR